MAPNLRVKVLEQCKVSPSPPDSMAELTIPLSFFDMSWLSFQMLQMVLFYDFPHIMLETNIIPDLKSSLSLFLKHYLPFAGNLIYPTNSPNKPILRYIQGDSIHVTFAESNQDFHYLKGNQPRNADDFFPLLPQSPQISKESDAKVIPLAAIQVTFFPGSGLSIGLIGHHILGDGIAILNGVKAWSSMHKLGTEKANKLLAGKCLAILDRSLISDKDGLAEKHWNKMKNNIRLINFDQPNNPLISNGNNKVLATFVLEKIDLEKLKNFVVQKSRKKDIYVSSFTVTCAYFWTCFVKSGISIGEEIVDNNTDEYFIAAIDCRSRVKPRVPENYFGNCIAPCIIKSNHELLASNEEGFVNAAIIIGDALSKKVQNEKGLLEDAKSWLSNIESVKMGRFFGVTGSPKMEIYELDYGWGKPEKVEILSILSNQTMSLNKARRSEGGLEVGLALPKTKMEAFEKIFNNGLMNMKF
ncbi:hypothetical protein M9H77_28135 [Catharanthus roseus]|uniref:Uncharacterized protein n=1 Tax=Catharanthus roseus TaxID=4058 RepID=A0ACC0AH53_CATRO|nr:hypothetical protein M9H77_28135 [Catharanthus roseus]